MSAAALLRAGRWREARSQADAELPHDLDGTAAAVLARIAVALGDPALAREAVRAATRLGAGPLVRLAVAEVALATGDPGAAYAEIAELAARDDLGELEPEVRLARSWILRAVGEPEKAYGAAGVALELAEQSGDPLAVEQALHTLGHAAWASGLVPEAWGAFERLLEQREARGAEPAHLAEAHEGLGLCARHRGDPFEAVRQHRAALVAWNSALGPGSGPESASRHRLAQALHRTGDFLAARDEMAQALLLTARTLGADHLDTWITRFEHARYEVDAGDLEHGFTRMEAARAEVARRLGRQHPVVTAMDRFL